MPTPQGWTLTLAFGTPLTGQCLDVFIQSPQPGTLSLRLDHEGVGPVPFSQEAACFNFPIPDGTSTIVMDMQGAAPADPATLLPFRSIRIMPRAIEAATMLQTGTAAPQNDRDLALRFVSLGDNCEFGIVQRRLGADPLDLYRFSAVPIAWILYGFDRGFAGIDQSGPHEVTEQLQGDGNRYWYVYQREYRIQFESGVRCDTKSLADMRRDSLRRMPFLAWRLMDTLRSGDRILVFRRETPLHPAEISALSHRLAALGSAQALVVHPDPTQDNPTIQRVARNVANGTIASFADPTRVVDTIRPDLWLPLMQQAQTLLSSPL
ncbi:hypothetical protein AA101099_1269 [Neoasaia chiangmaiensis NBRC 101099]|nr:hypothetical protein AA101099_1269 [Neoasaia chiangmaiensis NBRC 101099]GEN15813.1 hypothetical protein NCH01_22440 [Neoasaia chiangmaiensis]